jgi:hypothetical protein
LTGINNAGDNFFRRRQRHQRLNYHQCQRNLRFNQFFIAGVVDTGDKLITGVNDVINFNTVSFANCALRPVTPASCQAFPALCKNTAAHFQAIPALSGASSAHLLHVTLALLCSFRCTASTAHFLMSPALQQNDNFWSQDSVLDIEQERPDSEQELVVAG